MHLFLVPQLISSSTNEGGATLFAYPVSDPQRYGVVEFSSNGEVLNIQEKPKNPKSSYAVTGLYFYDNTVVERARLVKPSTRGELEITDLLKMYLNKKELYATSTGKGTYWFDAGSIDDYYKINKFVSSIQQTLRPLSK